MTQLELFKNFTDIIRYSDTIQLEFELRFFDRIIFWRCTPVQYLRFILLASVVLGVSVGIVIGILETRKKIKEFDNFKKIYPNGDSIDFLHYEKTLKHIHATNQIRAGSNSANLVSTVVKQDNTLIKRLAQFLVVKFKQFCLNMILKQPFSSIYSRVNGECFNEPEFYLPAENFKEVLELAKENGLVSATQTQFGKLTVINREAFLAWVIAHFKRNLFNVDWFKVFSFKVLQFETYQQSNLNILFNSFLLLNMISAPFISLGRLIPVLIQALYYNISPWVLIQNPLSFLFLPIKIWIINIGLFLTNQLRIYLSFSCNDWAKKIELSQLNEYNDEVVINNLPASIELIEEKSNNKIQMPNLREIETETKFPLNKLDGLENSNISDDVLTDRSTQTDQTYHDPFQTKTKTIKKQVKMYSEVVQQYQDQNDKDFENAPIISSRVSQSPILERIRNEIHELSQDHQL